MLFDLHSISFNFAGRQIYDRTSTVRARNLNQGKFTLENLQLGPWQINTEKSINYASISLSTLILATVFIFEQRLSGYDALTFHIMLAVFAISTLAYFVGLQFWFVALDLGGSNYSRVQYRRIATLFQTIGWLSLQFAGMLAVMAVDTLLGYIISFLGIFFLIFVIEYKLKVTLDDQHLTASLNDFQKQIDGKGIYIKKDKDFKPTIYASRDNLRILSWNIERGYNPNALAEYISQLDPDIVCLQEVDWGNKRTRQLDVLHYLAQKTGMQAAFSTEFFEIQTPYRTIKTAGGGIHGNAILSRLNFNNCQRIELPVIFDWENPPDSGKKIVKHEKRLGARFALCIDIEFCGQNITICSAHFEDKGGHIDGRLNQLEFIISQLDTATPDNKKIIAGDLNTIGNGLTHLIKYTKPSKLKSWYRSECEWWKREILPNSNYYDPFKCSDWTMAHSFVYKEKLDWILLDKSIISPRHGIGDFNSSDHRPIWVDIHF